MEGVINALAGLCNRLAACAFVVLVALPAISSTVNAGVYQRDGVRVSVAAQGLGLRSYVHAAPNTLTLTLTDEQGVCVCACVRE